ncbi:cytochrome P450 [Lentzea sp. CC55]|uniref:cytochrome P450 n=1 Tax=Lentzea sp. CC55 TaxID=2884909 RepID=UPI001F40CE8C|nr:cytochrome P450 [Lentzea sp. CC55]MCG8927335.1 cytochrome P450 [Lentzea sp. CC55]
MTSIDEQASQLTEMILIEIADFVELFEETFDLPSANGSAAPASTKTTSSRWHDLRALGFTADPYKVLKAVREGGPAKVIGTFGGANVWFVTRYDDARKVLAHPHVSSDIFDAPLQVNRADDPRVRIPDDGYHAKNIPLAMEDERHVRIRPLLVKALNPSRVNALKSLVEQTANRLVRDLPVGEPVDLHARYGVPLVAEALSGLLGIPSDTPREFPRWSDLLNFHMLDPQAARLAGRTLYGFCASLMESKRENAGDDALTDLCHARDEGILSDFEMHGLVVLMLHAGQEAHAALTNGLVGLLRHPDQLSEVLNDLSLLPAAIDELLRYEGPLRLTLPRHTNAPVELEGVTIPPREYVLVSLSAANHDAQRFEEPERVDIHRSDAKSHLAFGHGIHRCPGARLGTMVAQVGLHALFTRFSSVRFADPIAQAPWRPSMFLRRLESLPVVLD